MKLTTSSRLNKALYEMGIHTYQDVIFHIPRKYERYDKTSEDKPFKDKDKVSLTGKLISNPIEIPSFKVKKISFTIISEAGKTYDFIAYNQPYLLTYFNLENEYTFYGTYSARFKQITLSKVSKITSSNIPFKPIYTLSKDIKQFEYQRIVKIAFSQEGDFIDTQIPNPFLIKYNWPNKHDALYNLHFPSTLDDIKAGLFHLKYEEALSFSAKNKLISLQNGDLFKTSTDIINMDKVNKFIQTLPYRLTSDQEAAIREIIEDMNSDKLMYRLLQGDVGSGKTIVAFISLFANFLRGKQGALLAPTETLARQHYENMKEIFIGTKVKIRLLHGGMSKEEKNIVLDDLHDGTCDIVIGTHSLFSKTTKYSCLGLVVIDEQHRFGVNQRSMLLDKGKEVDMLMMSATPIPRSLAQTILSDLSLSTLFTFPNKKRSVETKLIRDEDEVFKEIDSLLKDNKKIYVVAPVIDSDIEEENNMKLFDKYKERYPDSVTLLNGRMNTQQKEEAIDLFKSGIKPILVATQVVELGIDVGDASLMVIYGARRLGLSSLHQLRGRVGRKGDNASCFIVINDTYTEEEIDRLINLTRIDNGFELSELDLKSRGPGEMLGLRQSGLPDFRYLNIVADTKIFKAASKDVDEMIKKRNENKAYSLYLDKIEKEIQDLDVIKA